MFLLVLSSCLLTYYFSILWISIKVKMTLLLYFFKNFINVTKNTIQLPILSFPLTDSFNCILDKILDKILWNEFRMFWSKITYCSVKWWINTWPWFEDELIFIFGEVVFFSSSRFIFYNRVDLILRGKISRDP